MEMTGRVTASKVHANVSLSAFCSTDCIEVGECCHEIPNRKGITPDGQRILLSSYSNFSGETLYLEPSEILSFSE